MTPLSAYLHVPFCRRHCGYCNFTVIAGRDDLASRYLATLAVELAQLGSPRPVETIFLGGGTPTHLSPPELQQLLALVQQWFPTPPSPSAPLPLPYTGVREFSVEANPRDVAAPEKSELLRVGGATRLSLGVQSFNLAKLTLLERDHDAAIVRQAAEQTRRAGLRLSLDLIFGAPGESLADWQRDLAQAIDLAPDHISTYGLTFEKGTTFWGRLSRGELAQASEDLERDMYLAAIDTLTAAGYEHYEVSNFALPGQRCRHNEAYWLGREYFAAGPGAARYVNGRREMNHRSTTAWMQRIAAGESPVAESEALSPEDRARERLVFGLRRLEGLDFAHFARETSFDIDQLAGKPITRFVAAGLLQRDAHTLRLTRAGLLVSDALWPHFLA